MRGDSFHNHLARKIQTILIILGFQVNTEYCVRRNGTITYLDLLAVKGQYLLGFEIETSTRHIIDNATKAEAVDIPVWFILPTQKLRKQAQKKLKTLDIKPAGQQIQLLLPAQLAQALTDYLSLAIVANSYADR